MQQVERRHATSEFTIDIHIGRIEYVARVGHRSHCQRTFVNGVEHRMRVTVDNTGHYILAGGVDYVSIRRSVQILADGGDLAVAYQHVSVLKHTLSDREHSGVANECLAALRV